ncbi:hypothetical protein COB55_01360 [Candidatus Wolfebacteria bacterium]|nr:MAG: hypothetical protein COB55_01360 [Candidatus Wolfebacteria bacterium]
MKKNIYTVAALLVIIVVSGCALNGTFPQRDDNALLLEQAAEYRLNSELMQYQGPTLAVYDGE